MVSSPVFLFGPRLRAREGLDRLLHYLTGKGKRLTSGLVAVIACVLHLGQVLVDLGPHVLQGLGGTAWDLDLGPRNGLVLVGDGNDVHEEFVLETRQNKLYRVAR